MPCGSGYAGCAGQVGQTVAAGSPLPRGPAGHASGSAVGTLQRGGRKGLSPAASDRQEGRASDPRGRLGVFESQSEACGSKSRRAASHLCELAQHRAVGALHRLFATPGGGRWGLHHLHGGGGPAACRAGAEDALGGRFCLLQHARQQQQVCSSHCFQRESG
jgi:hypothetical protein